MSSNNSNLTRAKKTQDDEFYTRIKDIEAEVSGHATFFRGKVVYCNCDDPSFSMFWRYFKDNFDRYGLERLLTSCYKPQTVDLTDPDKPIESAVWTDTTSSGTVAHHMNGNGDFRSWESQNLLEQCDVVVTNPPFSLFRDHVQQMLKFGKKFLVVGPMNAALYTDIFPYVKAGRIHMGYTPKRFGMIFDRPDGSTSHVTAGWYTNIELTSYDHRNLIMTKTYDPAKHPRYDNMNAIEIGSAVDIPRDYAGVMGVPPNFIGLYNPNQFEIIGAGNGLGDDPGNEYNRNAVLRGQQMYRRVYIRNRHPEIK